MAKQSTSAELRTLIGNEPAKTSHELALLANHGLDQTKHLLSQMVYHGQLVARYSAETLEQIYFIPGEASSDYHPETLAEAKIQQARFRARVNHYIADKILGEKNG